MRNSNETNNDLKRLTDLIVSSYFDSKPFDCGCFSLFKTRAREEKNITGLAKEAIKHLQQESEHSSVNLDKAFIRFLMNPKSPRIDGDFKVLALKRYFNLSGWEGNWRDQHTQLRVVGNFRAKQYSRLVTGQSQYGYFSSLVKDAYYKKFNEHLNLSSATSSTPLLQQTI